jgi:hypothetical protein
LLVRSCRAPPARAEAAVKSSDIPLQPDRLLDQWNAELGATGLGRELSDHVKAVSVAGIGGEDRGIERFGFSQTSRPVVLDRAQVELAVIDPEPQCRDLGAGETCCGFFDHRTGVTDRARLQQCFREREPVAGLLRVSLQRRRQKTQRQRKVALADGQCAKRVVGVRVIGLGFQDAAEQPLGIVDTPGVEVRQTVANSFVAGTGAR